MARIRKILFVFIFLAAAATGACLLLGGDEGTRDVASAETQPEPLQLSPVEVQRVEPRNVAAALRFTGTLRPAQRAIMTAQVSGSIDSIPVKIGQAVDNGAVLLRFDQAPLETALAARRAQRDAMQAQVRLAEMVLARMNRLGESGISSEATRLEAEANLANLAAQLRGLEAEVTDAERNLADGTVRAPFAGVISDRRVEPGQTVALNSELLSLVDLSVMEVEAGIPSSHIADVAVGQAARLTINGLAGHEFEARVVRVAPTAADGSRTITVFLELDNPQSLLKGGMFATGELQTGERDGVIAVPQAAIRQDEAGAFVLKVVDGQLQRQAVTAGGATPLPGLVEVTEGLAGGDVIIVAPLLGLDPGTPVVIEA